MEFYDIDDYKIRIYDHPVVRYPGVLRAGAAGMYVSLRV